MAQPTYTLEELSRKVDAISEFLNEKTDRNLLNLNTVGQAIIDGKVEVEALLEQNGYAKFTWKEGNKLSILLQWGLNPTGTNTTVNLPTSFSNTNYTFVNNYDNLPTLLAPAKVTRQSNTSFVVTANYGGNPVTNINIGWFAIGT